MYKPEGYSITADRWEQLHEAKKRGFPVEGTVERVTWVEEKPVWVLDMGEEIPGMVPFGETGLEREEMASRFIGQKVWVKVRRLDAGTRSVICSRKEVVEDAAERFFKEIKPGDVIPVVVKAVLAKTEEKPERLQVDVGGGVLVEVSRKNATRSQVRRLVELYPPGTSVRARVIQADRESNAIQVSLVDEKNPWEGFLVQRGDFLKGQVIKMVSTEKDQLVLLEIKPGIIGIANLPQRGRLKRGDVVPVAVTMVDPEKEKLHLRIRGVRLA